MNAPKLTAPPTEGFDAKIDDLFIALGCRFGTARTLTEQIMNQIILKPRSQGASTEAVRQMIQIGTRVISYHPKHYNYPGVVVKLAPLTVRITGQDVEINRVDLEVVS